MTFTLHTLKTTLTSLALSATLAASALPPGSYATSSALASGRWVKIKVAEAGMQQITAAELAEAGFTDPQRVGVYGFSSVDIADHALTAAKPDDLPPIPSICTDDGKLIFYAEAGERCGIGVTGSDKPTPAYRQNPSSLYGYYFLHETDSPVRPQTDTTPPAPGEPRRSVLTLLMHKYMDRYHTGFGTIILSENLSTLPRHRLTHSFEVMRPDPTQLPSYHVSYAAANSTEGGKISFSYPNAINTSSVKSESTKLYTYSFDDKATVQQLTSDCQAEVALTVRTDDFDFAAANYFAMLFYRLTDFTDDQSQMIFYNVGKMGAGEPLRFTNVTTSAPLEVWDLTTASAPVRLAVNADSESSAIAINKTARGAGSLSRFIAFKPDYQLNSVEIIGETANSDLHSAATPDLLIVTTPALLVEAEKLARLHRTHQQLDVLVADHISIFNEFSSGTPSADAIRRFAKMLYDRRPGKLHDIILLGTSYVNPRGIDATFVPDISTYLPTFPTEDISNQFNKAQAYSTDSFYGVMADGSMSPMSSAMDVNVGRIPASNSAEASAYIRKVERYLTCPAKTDVRSRVISVSDRGNKSGHTLQAIEIGQFIDSVAPGTHIFRDYDQSYFYKDNNPKIHNQLIADQLRAGVGLMTYCGHGNEVSIGSAPLWNRRLIASTPITDLPFVMLATCDSYPFDLGRQGIGHSFVLNPDGGAIAAVASCREVNMSYNQHLHLAVIENYFSADPTSTLGDVFRLAYNKIKSDKSDEYIFNTLCYSYIGDPSLPVYTYTHTLTTESKSLTLTPLASDNRISGTVCRPDGSIDRDFNGTLIADLYAPMKMITTQQHASSDTLRAVPNDGQLLATVRATVTDGQFDFNFDMPVVKDPGPGFELHLAAFRDNSHDLAAITLSDVTIDTSLPDSPSLPEAPSITLFSIDGTESADGVATDSRPSLHAEWLTPYSLSKLGVAGTSYIAIDGRRTSLSSIASCGSDGSGSLDFTPEPLAPGRHTATLYIADNSGRSAKASFRFNVVSDIRTGTLTADRPVASENVTIDLSHDFPTEPGGRLSIIDRHGNTVKTVTDPTFPFVWDCCDAEGQPVADGHYTIHAWLTHDRTVGNATPAEIVVIK